MDAERTASRLPQSSVNDDSAAEARGEVTQTQNGHCWPTSPRRAQAQSAAPAVQPEHCQQQVAAPDLIPPLHAPAPDLHIQQAPRPPHRVPANRQPTLGVKTTRATLKVASLNMRGGGSTTTMNKWQGVNQLLRDNKIGILAVQETHLKDEAIEQLHTQFHMRLHIHNSQAIGQTNSKGVGFVLNKQLTAWKEAIFQEIVPGRAALLTVPWQNISTVNILAIYAPNGHAENASFWDLLHEKWENENIAIPDIVLGDFNMVEDALDRFPSRNDTAAQTESLRKLKDLFSLTDGWRRSNEDTCTYSFTQTATGSRSRIDRIYTTEPLFANSREWQINQTAIHTDHKLVSAEFANPGAPYIGRGRWCIPLFAIKNRKVIQSIVTLGIALEQKISPMAHDDRLNRDTLNPQLLFSDFKKKVAALTKSFACSAAPKIDTQIKKHKAMLQEVLNKTPEENIENTKVVAAEIEQRITELEAIRYTQIRDNVAMRHRIEGESIGSKYWIQTNKEKKPRDTIPSLKNPSSPPDAPQYTTKSKEMAELAAKYHDKLQSQDLIDDLDPNETSAVLNHITPHLSAEGRTDLASYLTREEIQKAILALPNGKAAGIDGIPHELWKALMEKHTNNTRAGQPAFDIVSVLTHVYNDIEKHGVDPCTGFAEGWMCPIYKKGDKKEISNYRPITVLNSDYKIMTRALTTKLSKHVPALIHKDQAGFMKGRRIEDQTDLVRLMLDRCEMTEENGIIVCLDQEKAYDKIRHDFIWKSLEKFNFPSHFINTLKHIYGAGKTTVVINGVLSYFYKITRGVRQGDPLSCLIFNLAIESLASMLRASPLNGFQIPGELERLLTTLFADDTTVFLAEGDDLTLLHNLLQQWCRSSGAKFNVSKTVIIPVGTEEYRSQVVETRKIRPDREPIPHPITVAEDGCAVRVLGAFVGNRIDQTGVWGPTIEKLNARLKQWDRGHPTQNGRRLIVGMEVGGLTQYLTRVQGMPKQIEKEITRTLTKFMWDGGSSMVNATTLSRQVKEGGKDLLDLEARNDAIELMKLRSYLAAPDERP
ncbi:hypothetical protein CVT25_005500 [Psilocybe cyanescens]|uniref:Reverse transcriptase domain-containing protein n=1 Tax=Psilocybe cyanescens TaxID=93625 RepID=A0A409VZV3_PSICY|nr:hypothetical protein CVT25_005500 [Psilocybe cyanescens]